MKGLDWEGNLEEESWVHVSIVNAGSQATTITHLSIRTYKARFDRMLRRKPVKAGLVLNPEPGKLPS